MQRIRQENLSLHRYIKDTVLRDFVEKDEMVPLKLLSDISCTGSYVYQAMSSLEPSPIGRGRGWLFFDCPNYDSNGDCIYSTDTCVPEFVIVNGTDAKGNTCTGTPEQSNRVTVYDTNLVTLSGTDYLIDYADGRIILDNNIIVPKYVDYYWNYVSVLEEWRDINSVDTPVVVIDIGGTDKKGYQLGAGRKVTRPVTIHIFAASNAERSDIAEVIFDGLFNKSAPVYNFPTGDVLDYDGTFYGRKTNNNKLTSLFNRITLDDIEYLHGNMLFNKVSSRHIKLPLIASNDSSTSLSNLNAYRSKISFELDTYTRK